MNIRAITLIFLVLSSGFWAKTAVSENPGGWSESAAIRERGKSIVKFRARVLGDFLIVEAIHEPGWHTYAMDNELRAEEKLAGRQSLGVEEGVRIDVTSGGKVVGPWFQSPPLDLSKPDLRWFTWGFEGTATFAARIEPIAPGRVVARVGGQVCDGRACLPIDLAITVPPPNPNPTPPFSTEGLIPVKTPAKTAPSSPGNR
ncbi:MAG: hypothetical protein SFX72_15390 [Isosphaeraceae bacterium]|nr:hypothetical protein [Isosphaeraceae bacterium]